jgi:hypothetical protein
MMYSSDKKKFVPLGAEQEGYGMENYRLGQG